nr:TetR/AcrR family transcriptional regulator [Lysinibacillus timonensis]
MSKKEMILTVASSLILEKGFENISVDEIAKKSGMAKGSFYKYFQSKEDLIQDILLQMPKELETILKKTYSTSYDSSFEKLTVFLEMVIDTICDENRRFIFFDFATFAPILAKYDLSNCFDQIAVQSNEYYKEFFFDLYGEKVEKYYNDLFFLLNGIIVQYARVWRYQPNANSYKSASFIANVFESIVEGIVNKKLDPLVGNEWFQGQTNLESPIEKGAKLQKIFENMEDVIQLLNINSTKKREFLDAVSMLSKECRQLDSKEFLINALLNYLELLPELKKHCEEIKELL